MANILLIDDDDLLRDTVLQLLELDHHRVWEADSGEAGLRLFAAHPELDLVITDVLMPGIDGAQVIIEIRRTRPGIPIIAISGGRRVLTPEFNLETASLAGASCQLAKPFGRAEVQSAVAQALGSRVPDARAST